MKRILLIALAIVVASPIVAHAKDLTFKERHRQCRYESLDGHRGYVDSETKKLITCAVDHFPVSGGYAQALYIANRESGYECQADNPYSSASGVYQTVSSTWSSWWIKHSGFFNTRDWNLRNHVKGCRPNVMVSIRQAHQGGWGPWTLKVAA